MTAQITLTIEDDSVLQTVKQVLRNIKGVVKVNRVKDATLYSAAEWNEKLRRSSQQINEGKIHAMHDGESVDDFIDRLLCTE